MSDFTATLEGRALLASPFLDDPNFARSVVYMVRHTPEDAYGLIVNRPTDHLITEVIQNAMDCQLDRKGWLYAGGPVDGPLIALHDQADLADLQCCEGLFLTTNGARMLTLLERSHSKLKLFDGISGWGAGQLESERATGSWLVTDIANADILEGADDLWQRLLHGVGHQILMESGFNLGDPKLARWN